jgi:hypothetical protein
MTCTSSANEQKNVEYFIFIFYVVPILFRAIGRSVNPERGVRCEQKSEEKKSSPVL